MGINLALGYLLGICIGIPIGIYLEKRNFHFWEKKDVKCVEDEE